MTHKVITSVSLPADILKKAEKLAKKPTSPEAPRSMKR